MRDNWIYGFLEYWIIGIHNSNTPLIQHSNNSVIHHSNNPLLQTWVTACACGVHRSGFFRNLSLRACSCPRFSGACSPARRSRRAWLLSPVPALGTQVCWLMKARQQALQAGFGVAGRKAVFSAPPPAYRHFRSCCRRCNRESTRDNRSSNPKWAKRAGVAAARRDGELAGCRGCGRKRNHRQN